MMTADPVTRQNFGQALLSSLVLAFVMWRWWQAWRTPRKTLLDEINGD